MPGIRLGFLVAVAEGLDSLPLFLRDTTDVYSQ